MQARDLLVEVLRQDVDLVLVLAGLVKSSICASVWLVNEADMTKDGWPVALPRLSRRPSDRRMMRLPFGNSIRSTCGLMLVHFRLRSAAT
jgi:hypothetical protein